MKSFKKKLTFGKGVTDACQPTDAISIQICQKALNGKDQRVTISEGSGSWLEYIEFDGKTYWTVEDEKPEWISADHPTLESHFQEHLLPSDS